MRSLAIVGSSDLWAIPSIASVIAAALVSLEPDSALRLRADQDGKIASQVEELALTLAKLRKRGIVVFTYRPDGGGRAKVYERDYRLVEESERVIAFFHPERVMEGGTGHVVKAALDRGIPVEAWTIRDDGELEAIGSDDGLVADEEGATWLAALHVKHEQAKKTQLIEAIEKVAKRHGWK